MKIDIYKCNPCVYHENELKRKCQQTNQDRSKKTDFNLVFNEDIEILIDNINNMPRKIFTLNQPLFNNTKKL